GSGVHSDYDRFHVPPHRDDGQGGGERGLRDDAGERHPLRAPDVPRRLRDVGPEGGDGRLHPEARAPIRESIRRKTMAKEVAPGTESAHSGAVDTYKTFTGPDQPMWID